ncbi:MAG: carbon-nitrogen hydrolase family protein [Lachnospiraceae bacterium]|nr:carbon-nitrogen hydrolase family protein [Lachnospiraceae bacterium]
MRLALAQMSMVNDINRNYNKSLQFLDLADNHKVDLIFFPEMQFTPFFAQYKKREVGGVLNHIPDEFAIELSDKRIQAMADRCKRYGFFASPNLYIKSDGAYYNMSLWIDPAGRVSARSKTVHVTNTTAFHEKEYFTESEDGFFVYETPFGLVGIVIGFDRHLPESISACADRGADLVIIPAANVTMEPLQMYEWEARVAAFQNGIFVAMANRVGDEDALSFAGESIVVNPDGDIVVKADDSQQFIVCNVELSEAAEARKRRPFRQVKKPRLGRGRLS